MRTICRHLDHLSPRADGQSHASRITYVVDRKGHDRRYAIDDGKAQAELGFTRQHDFDGGLAETVRWYVENQAWCELVLGVKV